MKKQTYTRVIPRDFFNEAKLLKCMGQLSLKILDNQLPEGVKVEIEDSGDPFKIHLSDDGLLYISNYKVLINDCYVFIGSTYNSKNAYPLVCVIDYTEYPVFNEDGSFSDEFCEINNVLQS